MASIAVKGRISAVAARGSIATGLRGEVVRGDVRVIEAVADEWRQLCDEGPNAYPFLRPEWIVAYLRVMEPNARLLLVTVRRGNRLCALLPLVEERTRLCGVPIKRLRWPNDPRWPDRVDLIHGADDPAPAIAEIWRRLAATPRWDLLDLADVPPDGALAELVAFAAGNGHPSAERVARRTPYVPLAEIGGDFDAAVAHVNAKFRSTVRRRMRHLEKLGPVRLVRLEQADPDWLDAFFRMEAAGWKGKQGTAIACSPESKALHEAHAREAARLGYLTLYSLECAGEPVAMHLGLTMNGRYMVPKLTYDEAKSEYSPGHLILQEIFRDCVARGIAEVDFLGNSDDWKERWGKEVRVYRHSYIFRRGIAARSAHALRFRILPVGRRHYLRLRALRAPGAQSAGATSPAFAAD
jgi:CelD/BcsL family acetyltransferase involved in cellulose biosynthesis